MLRVVERVLGEGPLYREGLLLLSAGYELTLYQDWHAEGNSLVPGGFDVGGHLLASPGDLERALGTQAPLTLHLDARRRVDLYVLNTDGAITSADNRGFYEDS